MPNPSTILGGTARHAAVPCLVLALAAPSAARAVPITYAFTGTVTQTTGGMFAPPFTVGQQVPISITVDGSFPNSSASSGVGLYTNGSNPSVNPLIAATIGGQNELELFSTITVRTGNSITISSGGPMAGGFGITLSGAHAGVLATDAIPLTLDPGDFDTATFADSVTPTATSASGTLGSAVAVPAPASLPLLATGLAALLPLRRRLRRTE